MKAFAPRRWRGRGSWEARRWGAFTRSLPLARRGSVKACNARRSWVLTSIGGIAACRLRRPSAGAQRARTGGLPGPPARPRAGQGGLHRPLQCLPGLGAAQVPQRAHRGRSVPRRPCSAASLPGLGPPDRSRAQKSSWPPGRAAPPSQHTGRAATGQASAAAGRLSRLAASLRKNGRTLGPLTAQTPNRQRLPRSHRPPPAPHRRTAS